MTDRERLLERALKEIGVILARVTHNGKFNPEIADALERARHALKKGTPT